MAGELQQQRVERMSSGTVQESVLRGLLVHVFEGIFGGRDTVANVILAPKYSTDLD